MLDLNDRDVLGDHHRETQTALKRSDSHDLDDLDGLDDRTGTPLAGSSYPAKLSRVWAEVLVRLHGPSSTGGNWK